MTYEFESQAALNLAEAQLNVATQNMGSSVAVVVAARANLQQEPVLLVDAEAEFRCTRELSESGIVARTTLDKAKAAQDSTIIEEHSGWADANLMA